MPGFLYFVPRAGISLDDLRATGLGYAFDGSPISRRQVDRGPNDSPGVIIARESACPPAQVAYTPKTQTWRKAIQGEFWIGHQKDHLPGPADLARPEQIALYQHIMGDGNPWALPTAITASGDSPLPKVRRMKDDGSIERVVQERYRQLYLDADAVRSLFITGEVLNEREYWNICVRALQTNYYVGSAEITILDLLTDIAVMRILTVLVDRQNWPDVAQPPPIANGGAA